MEKNAAVTEGARERLSKAIYFHTPAVAKFPLPRACGFPRAFEDEKESEQAARADAYTLCWRVIEDLIDHHTNDLYSQLYDDVGKFVNRASTAFNLRAREGPSTNVDVSGSVGMADGGDGIRRESGSSCPSDSYSYSIQSHLGENSIPFKANKYDTLSLSEIPTALLHTGSNVSDHPVLLKQISANLIETRAIKGPRPCVLRGDECGTIQATVKHIVQSFINSIEEETDGKKEFFTAQDFLSLHCWYKSVYSSTRTSTANVSKTTAMAYPPLVILFDDFERFSGPLLNTLIHICRQWLPSLPFVFIFSIASYFDRIHDVLSRTSLSALSMTRLTLRTAKETVSHIMNSTLMDARVPVALAHRPFQSLLDCFLFYRTSVAAFTNGLQSEILDHYAYHPLSAMCVSKYADSALTIQSLSASQCKYIRNLRSTRRYIEFTLEDHPQRQMDILTNDAHLKCEIKILIDNIRAYRETLTPMLLCFLGVLKLDPKFGTNECIFGTRIRDVYASVLEQSVSLRSDYERVIDSLWTQGPQKVLGLLDECIASLSVGITDVNLYVNVDAGAVGADSRVSEKACSGAETDLVVHGSEGDGKNEDAKMVGHQSKTNNNEEVTNAYDSILHRRSDRKNAICMLKDLRAHIARLDRDGTLNDDYETLTATIKQNDKNNINKNMDEGKRNDAARVCPSETARVNMDVNIVAHEKDGMVVCEAGPSVPVNTAIASGEVDGELSHLSTDAPICANLNLTTAYSPETDDKEVSLTAKSANTCANSNTEFQTNSINSKMNTPQKSDFERASSGCGIESYLTRSSSRVAKKHTHVSSLLTTIDTSLWSPAKRRRVELLKFSGFGASLLPANLRKRSKFEAARDELVGLLDGLFRRHLVAPTTLPLHEIFFHEHEGGKGTKELCPRSTIQTRIARPQTILKGLPDDDILSDSLPDVVIAYKLHLECGRYINLTDWMEAFACIIDPELDMIPEDDEDFRPKKKKRGRQSKIQQERESRENRHVELRREIQARFTSAVRDLQFLGFIRPTKRKVDHVERLTWGHV